MRRRRAGTRKGRPKSRPESSRGQYAIEARGEEFDTFFSLCASGQDYISMRDLLLILQALNLEFEESRLLAAVEEIVVESVDEIFPVTFALYQRILNHFIREKSKALSVQRDDDFRIFSDDEGLIDVKYLKRVTGQIGNKLSDEEFDTFFAELKDHIQDGKISARVLYDFTKCQ